MLAILLAAIKGMEVLPALQGALWGRSAILEVCCLAQAHLHHHHTCVKHAVHEQPNPALQACCPERSTLSVPRFCRWCCLELSQH